MAFCGRFGKNIGDTIIAVSNNILLLGSKGTIGTYLSNLLKSQFEVFEFNEKFEINSKHLQDLVFIIKKHKVTCIINCLGATNVARCEVDSIYARNGNILIPTILRSLQSYFRDETYVINFSSDQVYPGFGNHLETAAMPQNAYGKSKLLGESKLTVNSCNLRINYVSKGIGRSSLSDWVVQTASTKVHVDLYSDLYFNPVDLTTIGRVVSHALQRRLVGAFNIGSIGKLSKADFYLELSRSLGIWNPNYNLVKYYDVCKIQRPLDMSMNISKVKRTGFELPSVGSVIENLTKEYEIGNRTKVQKNYE